jgi:hypothetical protein
MCVSVSEAFWKGTSYCMLIATPVWLTLSKAQCALCIGRWPIQPKAIAMWLPCVSPYKKVLRAVDFDWMKVSWPWLCNGCSSARWSLWMGTINWFASNVLSRTIPEWIWCKQTSSHIIYAWGNEFYLYFELSTSHKLHSVIHVSIYSDTVHTLLLEWNMMKATCNAWYPSTCM